MRRTFIAVILVTAFTCFAHAQVKPQFDEKDAAKPRIAVSLVEVASGFEKPVDIQFAPGSTDTMFVLEQEGRIKSVSLKNKSSSTVLALSVLDGYELGLLGLAFHPQFAKNRKFYINYNPKDKGPRRTRISEWRLDEDGKAKDEKVILEFEQPFSNHNGGALAFGPDGYLYIGTGDGGSAGDPLGNGQNPKTLLGKMLRLDVNRADKKFVPEVWARGLRNPWRYSYDAKWGWIVADVGQGEREEITLLKKGDNAGWSIKEGSRCFKPATNCRSEGLKDPVIEYGRDEGGTIVGGYVYQGKTIAALSGKYVYGDYISGRLWAAEFEPLKVWSLGKWPVRLSTFGRDAAGEIYLADIDAGKIYRFSK